MPVVENEKKRMGRLDLAFLIEVYLIIMIFIITSCYLQ